MSSSRPLNINHEEFSIARANFNTAFVARMAVASGFCSKVTERLFRYASKRGTAVSHSMDGVVAIPSSGVEFM